MDTSYSESSSCYDRRDNQWNKQISILADKIAHFIPESSQHGLGSLNLFKRNMQTDTKEMPRTGNYLSNQDPLFFQKIKKRLETICFHLEQPNISLERKRQIIMALANQLNGCSAGVYEAVETAHNCFVNQIYV